MCAKNLLYVLLQTLRRHFLFSILGAEMIQILVWDVFMELLEGGGVEVGLGRDKELLL